MTATNNSNPWVVKPPKQSAPVPDGHYIAEFSDVFDYSHENLDGGKPKWKWVFRVISGDYAEKTADTVTDPDINPNTLAGRIIAGLIGRDIHPGEDVKAAVDACKGKRRMITVARGPQGGKSAVRFVGDVPQM